MGGYSHIHTSTYCAVALLYMYSYVRTSIIIIIQDCVLSRVNVWIRVISQTNDSTTRTGTQTILYNYTVKNEPWQAGFTSYHGI